MRHREHYKPGERRERSDSRGLLQLLASKIARQLTFAAIDQVKRWNEQAVKDAGERDDVRVGHFDRGCREGEEVGDAKRVSTCRSSQAVQWDCMDSRSGPVILANRLSISSSAIAAPLRASFIRRCCACGSFCAAALMEEEEEDAATAACSPCAASLMPAPALRDAER